MRSALHYRNDQVVTFAVIFFGLFVVSAPAVDLMPVARQNALIQKYCTVCHTDASKNGGLSLERFDAAQVSPSLAAMLLSKLTGGVALATVSEVSSKASAAASVDKKVKGGAMGAAGIPVPDKPTVDALIHALAVESTGATEWSVQHRGKSPIVEASILREKPIAKDSGEARAYRLILSCEVETRHGSMQLAWSPQPQKGTFTASLDGKPAVKFQVDGSEKMGNGSNVVTQGLAAVMLTDTKNDTIGLPLPLEALIISDLFPGETVAFPFAKLPMDAREELQVCFSGTGQSNR